MMPKKMYQLFCSQRDMLMTNCVNAGRSAPKPLNRDSNCGITNSNRITVTTTATTMTAAG